MSVVLLPWLLASSLHLCFSDDRKSPRVMFGNYTSFPHPVPNVNASSLSKLLSLSSQTTLLLYILTANQLILVLRGPFYLPPSLVCASLFLTHLPFSIIPAWSVPSHVLQTCSEWSNPPYYHHQLFIQGVQIRLIRQTPQLQERSARNQLLFEGD